MQMRFMRVRLLIFSLIFFSLPVSEAAAQLFYDDCAGAQCRKAFIEKKEKIGDELYFVQTMFLTYHQRGTTSADEQHKSAKVSCDKSKPMVTWGSGKARMIDKSILAKNSPKKGKVTESEKPPKYDEAISLWKKICPAH